jgi:hypothetical protein
MTRCDELEPLLGELALGLLADDRRSEVMGHVAVCLSCRALLLELSGTADLLLTACPAAEPSPGFDAAVMARIGPAQRRPSRRSIVAAAVAAVVLVAGGLTVGLRLRPPEELRTAPLVAEATGTVGDAAVYAGRPAWVFMRIDRGLADGTYRCVVTADAARPTVVGTLVVHEGRGSWSQRIEPPVPSRLRTARIETGDGAVVASASFR